MLADVLNDDDDDDDDISTDEIALDIALDIVNAELKQDRWVKIRPSIH